MDKLKVEVCGSGNITIQRGSPYHASITITVEEYEELLSKEGIGAQARQATKDNLIRIRNEVTERLSKLDDVKPTVVLENPPDDIITKAFRDDLIDSSRVVFNTQTNCDEEFLLAMQETLDYWKKCVATKNS